MQRESARRGFSINHQKVVLEIDFSGTLFGYTEITIVPTSKDLRTIYLHSRQCNITSVQVGGFPVKDWAHNDPMTNITTSDITDCHRHPELKRRLYSAQAECDEGELAIPVPKQALVRSTATPEPYSLGQNASHATSASQDFAPVVVRIVYSLRNPVDGFQFVLPTDAYPYRVPHAYTTPSSPDSARCWVPCVDNLWEKCTWEFEFIVPKYLEEDADAMDVDGEEGGGDTGLHPVVVVCSGELVEKIAHPNNSNKCIFLFSQAVLTSVQHIAFAAGPFTVQSISSDAAGLSEDSAGSQTMMHAFCLPGHEAALSTTASFMRSAMNFYSSECGSYPFGSYKIVFVDELPTQKFDSATLTLAPNDLLHGDDAIDQVFETRQVLSHALAVQWAGINIIPKTWSDTWLVNGLGLYITGLFLRKLFGVNEYRFRLKKDMDRILERDNGAMPPICQPTNFEPPDSAVLAFINLKAPVVLHILDRRLGKSGTSLGLSRVLPKIFLSAISGEMPQNSLSTHSFLRTCRKVSGVDLRSFTDQWIYGSGCPHFSFLATFNRKKMAVEIQMRQECPAYLAHRNDPYSALVKPVQFFEGQMTVRIHEADGTPYEHVLDILAPTKRFEVPFNTKYKRVRRNTKRYLARQAAAQAAAEGDLEAAEAIGMIDMGFGLDVWEKEEERDRWKVADWTEEEEQAMAGATYEWIRMDADFEWIARIQFEQADYMWVSQLQRDRDVVAQLEAVHALARTPTPIVSSTLTKTVLVTNYFFRIRCEAAQALVNCATRTLEFVGLFHLFKLFLRYCYELEDPDQDLFAHKYVPRPNDFSDFAEYFVRKSLISAISRVRLENGKTPPVVRQFFIDQLRYNDNTKNSFTDAYYICTLISALACATVSTAPPERGELTKSEQRIEQTPEDVTLLSHAISEVERYRSMDRLIPSVHNIVTVAALEFHLIINMANMVPSDPKIFLTSTREGNALQVRLAGFDGLFLMRWYTPRIMRYILATLANDSSRTVRRHVARNVCESLALLASIGEIKHASKDNESLLIEDDGTGTPKEAKKSEVEMMIRALRKDKEVGKSDVLRDYVMPIILDPKADHEVRWCMLKLADLAVRGTEEPLPKVTIHLPPPTPSMETPATPLPQTPILKIVPKVKAPIKMERKNSIILSTPSTPVGTGPPKLKLLPSSALAQGATSPATPQIPPVKLSMPPPPAPLVKKKDKPLPKAQSSGMSANDLKACRNALKKLKANKHAALFQQPVDPVRDKAPAYFEIIKNPMDLSTMNAKLEEGLYNGRNAFEADFRLMIQNCKTYNSAGTFVHGEAVALQSFFDKLWSRIVNTLEVADRVATQNQAHANAVSVASASASMPPPPPPVVETPKASKPKIKISQQQQQPKPAEVNDVPATPSKPTIKLKLGGSQTPQPDAAPKNTPAPTAPVADESKPARAKPSKPRVKKAKDMPPPPYIDDGSHDLLQEVIAMEEMEREDGSKKASSSKHTNGKPRKVIDMDLDADDELLSLALDDEKPMEKTPVRHVEPEKPEKHEKPEPAPAPVPAPVPPPTKILHLSQKAKKTAPPEPVSTPPRPARPSSKGKEKEVVPSPVPAPAVVATPPRQVKKASTPAHSPAAHTPTATAHTQLNEKKCKDVLKNLTKLPQAVIFNRPVDPVNDGCPTYYDEIKHPMDFSTMKAKLEQGLYNSMEEFAADVNLIFRNCRAFNPPTTHPVLCADAVERAFKKEWAKAMEKKLTFQEKRSLQSVMTKLRDDIAFFVFREPVDPVVLGIPTYFDVIPKKDARDLRTIRTKLDQDKYDSIDAWEADMQLMIQNAITFNGLESEVGQVAVRLQNKLKEMVGGVRAQISGAAGNKKRTAVGAENGKGSAGVGVSTAGVNGVEGGATKKARLA